MLNTIRTFFDTLGNFALSNLLPAIIIAVVGILLVQLLMKMVTKFLEKSKLEKAAHSLITSVLKVVCYVLLLLIIASRLGIDVTSIVALASVLTLAVSLALQNMLANVIGGFTLLYTKPFASGDFVEIAGQSGVVNEIGLTYTKLATADNKMVSIPNSAVIGIVCLALFVLFLVIAINPDGALLMVLQSVIMGLIGQAGFYFAIPALL